MADVRGYWNLHGGRLLLQSYRFVRRLSLDDKLDCADSQR
jgi:hypothetical protein